MALIFLFIMQVHVYTENSNFQFSGTSKVKFDNIPIKKNHTYQRSVNNHIDSKQVLPYFSLISSPITRQPFIYIYIYITD